VIRAKARGRIDPDTGDFMPAITVNSLDLARLIAMESDALFPGTASMVAQDVAGGRLVRLDFRIPVMATEYGFVYLRDRTLSPAARAFMDEMRAVEGKLAVAEGEAPRTTRRSPAPRARRISSNRPRPAPRRARAPRAA
jgi:DNA-binding transcriptional LysR family regulator